MLPRRDYHIDDNWHVAGLRGTGSKDIVVDSAFVPEHRSQSHWDYMLGRELPGWILNSSPLYRLPFAVVFNYALTASVLGAARGFLELWIEMSRSRKLGLGGVASEDPFIQKILSEACYSIETGFLVMRRDCEELIETARVKSKLSLSTTGRNPIQRMPLGAVGSVRDRSIIRVEQRKGNFPESPAAAPLPGY
jgi:3-hydroxy-9,10-secoandrosta-1,3,5(10)-triene-9,17-dione monooxygenase